MTIMYPFPLLLRAFGLGSLGLRVSGMAVAPSGLLLCMDPAVVAVITTREIGAQEWMSTRVMVWKCAVGYIWNHMARYGMV